MTSYVRRFIERGVRGVAIMTSEFDRGLLAELARRDVPVVFLDAGRPGRHEPSGWRRSIIPIASASCCQCGRRSSSANRQRPRRKRARRHCGAASTQDHRATVLPVPCLIVTTRSAGPPLNRSFVPPGHVISIAS